MTSRLLATTAALVLLGIASATAYGQDAASTPAGFVPIHMDNQKLGSAVTAFWQDYASETTGSVSVATGSVSVVTGNPITTEDIDGSLCAPGQLVVHFDTGNLVCEWAVAE
jgi:hypothetical protein